MIDFAPCRHACRRAGRRRRRHAGCYVMLFHYTTRHCHAFISLEHAWLYAAIYLLIHYCCRAAV